MPSTLQVDKIIDGSATTNKELAEYASGNWSWGSGVPQHTIIQVVTDENSNTGAGVTVTGSHGSSNSHGYQLFNTSFTPKFSNSKILIQTSNVFIGEEANNGNWGWINAWYDTTKVASATGTSHYSAFSNLYNWTLLCLNHAFNSWGTTTKSINVRCGMDAGTIYVKNSSGTSYNSQAMTIGLIIIEVAQ